MNPNERFLRQREIVPQDRMRQVRTTVVGVGAIGRQLALQLAAIGVPWLQLIDHDTVETVNLASQGYFEQDVGRPKVAATGDLCRQINSGLSLHTEQERFRRSMQIGNVVFLAVDSITTRQHIWDAIKDRADFVCDGRMAAEALRVLTACDRQGRAHYPTTMFTAEQAYAGACTAKSTIYCANIAAGLMVGQLTKWLRNMPVDPDICLNLLSAEFNVLQPAAIG